MFEQPQSSFEKPAEKPEQKKTSQEKTLKEKEKKP